MSKGKKILVGVIVVLAVAGISVANLKRSQVKKEEVRLDKVEQRTVVSTVRAPGRVQPAEYVNLSAQVPGRIIQLPVAEGDTVTRGQLLIRLDDTQYRAAVEASRAAVKSAQATYELTKARLERSRQTLQRQKTMADQKMVSPEAVEIAVTEVRVAEAELAARAEDISRARSSVETAQDDLSKTVYSAPTAGVISKLNVKLGEIVITGTMNNPGTVIMTIADLSRMQVEAEVDETDVVDVRPGQEVKITVDAMPDTSFRGVVTTIAASAQTGVAQGAETATNFLVKTLFADDIPSLRPGMTADVEVTTAKHENSLTIPLAALVARDRRTLERQKKQYEERKAGGGSKANAKGKKGDSEDEDEEKPQGKEEKLIEGVFVFQEGHALFVPVRTGISDDTHIEIFTDLKAGDQVVGGPYKTLRELKYGADVKAMDKKGKKGKGSKGEGK